jgi:beta-lactamase regulating signal transducer with metallopeptidase domain
MADLVSTAATAGWMLYALVIGGIVTLAALAAHDAQRAANRPVRWVWFGAIIAIVGLSALAPLRRSDSPTRITMPAAAASNQPVGAPRIAQGSLPQWWQRTRDAVVAPFAVVLQASQQTFDQWPVNVHRALGLGWLLASAGTIGVFAVSYQRSRRRMQQWPVQRVGDATARISPSVGPAVIGLAPSEIILPSWLLRRSREEQQLVLAHETEHVRAGDPWLLVVACGAVALMPWHPALWFALGRLRLAVELDCDRRVLRQGIPAASYGALLIDLSALRTALPSAMPAFSCSGSYLERRLVAMTARRSRFATSRRALGAVVALAAIATACESKLPTSAEINAMDASAAAKQATDAKLVDEASAYYVVDDKKVSAEVAKAIPAGDIAEVRIVGKSANSAGEIRLRTKGSLLAKSADSVVTFEAKSDGKLTRVQGMPLVVEGRAGAPGVMLRKSPADPAAIDAPRTPVQGTSLEKVFDGLLVVDGEIVTKGALDNINPETIATVEVVKGSAAKARYSDPRAANGVIVVTTKAKK